MVFIATTTYHFLLKLDANGFHEQGFQILDHKKGTCVDGHEWTWCSRIPELILEEDVYLGIDNAITPEAELRLSQDLEVLLPNGLTRLSTINPHFKQKSGNIFLGNQGYAPSSSKGKGTNIMVSDFIDEHNWHLRLTEEEFAQGLQKHPDLKWQARVFSEYGENKESYWNFDKFLVQIKRCCQDCRCKISSSKGIQGCMDFWP